VNESKRSSEVVKPFLDWFLVQAGSIRFTDKNKQILPSPQPPFGININSQEAEKTPFWLKAEKPWEAIGFNGYLTVIYEDGVYRLWYESMGADYEDDSDSKLCYAESSDGFNWKKPILNLVEYEGDKRTNIVFDKNSSGGFGYHGGTVFLDPIASPSERYKLIYFPCQGGKSPCLGRQYQRQCWITIRAILKLLPIMIGRWVLMWATFVVG